jgi:hypothetical protein
MDLPKQQLPYKRCLLHLGKALPYNFQRSILKVSTTQTLSAKTTTRASFLLRAALPILSQTK